MAGFADTFRGMGGAKLGALALVTIVTFAFFIVLVLRMNTASMAPLYTSLSLEDSAKIVAELEKSNTPYELMANGSQIMVPADKVLRMRMSMAEEGLPSGGSIVGYEIFDRSESFGSSSFVMNINMLRALEGELSRTISSLSDVEGARVQLVMPKQELFTREKEKPSASVTVKMRGGHTLEHGEVIAIAHLVASAVPALEASKVTIVDSHGRLLARGDGDNTLDASASNGAEYRTAYETHMQQNLEEMLDKVVGDGKARVTVSADINFDRTVTNSEKFDPDGQVARSTQSTSNKELGTEKAGKEGVSVGNNLPQGANGGAEGNSSNHSTEHTDDTVNYEISKTTQNHIQEGGNINKVSVAVLVDGNYTTDADGKQTYAPRSDDEMKQLKSLIVSAIGYDEKRGDKIELVNMRFTQEDTKEEGESFFSRFKIEMESIIQTLIIAVVAVLAILLVLRPAVTQLIRQIGSPSGRVAGELAALEAPSGGGGSPAVARLPGGGGGGGGEQELMIDVANIRGGMKSSSMKKITEIVDKYPEETMGVLRQWFLKQS